MRVARVAFPSSQEARGDDVATAGDERFVRLDGPVAFLFDIAPWLGGRETGQTFAWDEKDLRCPVIPSKIVCIGRNYAAHAKELGNAVPSEPLLFLKPPSARLGPLGVGRLPAASARVEHEAELAVVMSRQAKDVGAQSALDYVFGYSCACDVTARDLQKK